MILTGLLAAVRQHTAYAQLLGTAAAAGTPLQLSRAARVPVLATLAQDLARPLLVLVARSDRALVLQEELECWTGSAPLLFSEPNSLFYDRTPRGARALRQRMGCLAACSAPAAGAQASRIIIASARALLTRTLPPADFAAHLHVLQAGGNLPLNQMLASWLAAGYSQETVVVEPGQFCRRGGIIDIWPITRLQPVRIELFGDEIERMREFEPGTQRSADLVDSVSIVPAREALPANGPELAARLQAAWPGAQAVADTGASSSISEDLMRLAAGVPFPELEFYLPWLHPESATLLDYMPADCLVVADDWEVFEDTVQEFEEQALELRAEQIAARQLPSDAPAPHVSWSDLQDQLSTMPLVILGGQQREAAASGLAADFAPGPRLGGQIPPLVDLLHKLRADGDHVVIVSRQAARLAELWGEHAPYHAPVELVNFVPQAGSALFVQGALAEGWVLRLEPQTNGAAEKRLHLLTDAEIFGWSRPEPRQRTLRRTAAAAPESAFEEFQPGDLVVHLEHGIGQFTELVTRTLHENEREYLLVVYENGDHLYVPITQADQLSRYIGPDERTPELSRLGSAEWARARDQARQAAEVLAQELLDLYARRAAAPGYAFSADARWQQELAASFPYTETEDQQRAIASVTEDMERPRPMDRLICGDVGYGKTEVALRAAFKAIADSKQVAILVPTTVLAQQHFQTFQRRLAAFPVRVEMLSRFRNAAQQRQIVKELAAGTIDIIIGTHRLVQADVQFKDLGLLIIDEEQRFGVTHKEHLKSMRTTLDILTLTATPIPRTLYLSLTGVRDISTINTPPNERLPVITHVGPFKEHVLRQAILRELDRQGQVFFVHNRVQTIQTVRAKLAALLPEARLTVAHGQMPEKQLEQVMAEFIRGEHDILLCTSIIESGLDIPNANTLIVDRADTFGLAQLYQLRGRVGRGANRAYAYFLHSTQGRKRITEDARERLQTIAEQTELGAGYSIAMRDLEMRGAGDILGKRQSGHIAAVGFHLYTRLLRKAVNHLRASSNGDGRELPSWDLSLIAVDLPLEVGIPPNYIPDQALRVRLYRRLAELSTEQSIAEMRAELEDRFGALPAALRNLLYQLRVKLRAYGAGVEAVGTQGGLISLRSRFWESDAARATLTNVLPAGSRISKGKVWLPREPDPAQWKPLLFTALDKLTAAFNRA